MKRGPNFELFHQIFSLRVKVLALIENSLKANSNDIESLTAACASLSTITNDLSKGDVEDKYRRFYYAASIFLLLAQWKKAIRDADNNPDRFLQSARLQLSEIDESLINQPDSNFFEFSNKVAALKDVSTLNSIQDLFSKWELPLPFYLSQKPVIPSRFNTTSSSESLPKETTVAFLRFDIDGQPAKQFNYLKPGTAHDLTLEIRVSNWPQDVSCIDLKPVTIDVREREWLPSFSFEKPSGNEPYTLKGTGRLVLEVAHSFGSRPYEFLYAAEFKDSKQNSGVSIVGHRRLLLEGTDINNNPITGFSYVDKHLIHIRNQLRIFYAISEQDIAHTMIALGGLGSVYAQSLKMATFDAKTPENKFQQKVYELLSGRSDIGENLQSHLEAAGGITDLTFHDIPIELKVEHKKTIAPDDCKKYFDQTASYALALGKKIGILAMLESSPKASPIGNIEDDFMVFQHTTGNTTVLIAVIIIRGGFPKPSSYSK